MDYEKYFKLESGEKIIESIKPLSNLKRYMILGGLSGFVSVLLIFGFILFIFVFSENSIYVENLDAKITLPKPEITTLLLIFLNTPLSLLMLLLLVLPFVTAHLSYNKMYYWVTNNRVIYKRGLIGYRISSIPLERISDIIITRTFLENLFGFGSIHIQSMAGQFSGYGGGYGRRGRRGLGSEGQLLAVPDPEGLQKLVFELIKKKRKSEKLTM